jgi:uncharacterized protein
MPTALVTGGTSGIGAGFARAYAARGVDLVLVARDKARLAAMAAELHSVSVETLVADLSDRRDVAKVAKRLEDSTRPVDILVNNAGFSHKISLLARDTDEFDRGLDVMLRAVLVLGGAAARAMVGRGSGSIINVGSTSGYIPTGAYSAIKAWVMSYTEALSTELRGTGVTTTVLAPGWVHTEFHDRGGVGKSAIPDFLWLDADKLVASAIRDAERGVVVSIPTLRYKVIIWFVRRLPQRTTRWLARKISTTRSEAQRETVGAE